MPWLGSHGLYEATCSLYTLELMQGLSKNLVVEIYTGLILGSVTAKIVVLSESKPLQEERCTSQQGGIKGRRSMNPPRLGVGKQFRFSTEARPRSAQDSSALP